MENRVFKFLTAANGTTLEPVGQALYQTNGTFNLAVGQVGIYNYDTKVSVDATTILNAKRVFIAVGRDSDGDGNVDYIDSSLPIDTSKLLSVEKQGYVAPVAQVKEFAWNKTDCETEYCVQFTLESVEISEYMGFNPLRKTFSYTTDCCDDNCDTCGGGDCTKLASELVDLINADPDGFVTASLVTANDLKATTVDITGIDNISITVKGVAQTASFNALTDDAASAARLQNELNALLNSSGAGGFATVEWIAATNSTVTISNTTATAFDLLDAAVSKGADAAAADEDSCPSIRVTTNFAKVANFCHLPVNMVKANGINLEITGLCGFDCNFTVSTVTDLVYEMNSGVVLKDTEEEATGFGENSLYRYTSLIQPDTARTLYVDASKTYTTLSVESIDRHEGAPSGHMFDSVQKTIIAFETADTAQADALETILNAVL